MMLCIFGLLVQLFCFHHTIPNFIHLLGHLRDAYAYEFFDSSQVFFCYSSFLPTHTHSRFTSIIFSLCNSLRISLCIYPTYAFYTYISLKLYTKYGNSFSTKLMQIIEFFIQKRTKHFKENLLSLRLKELTIILIQCLAQCYQ